MAAELGIANDLVVRYARILVAAEDVLASRAELEEETKAKVVQVAAAEHGIEERDPKKARAAYSAARQAQQEIHNSVKGCASRLSRLEDLLRERYRLIQVDVANRFPRKDILAAIELIKAFAAATAPHPHNLAEVKMIKSDLSLSRAGHTLLWWRLMTPPHRFHWADTYALALCWRVSDAKDIAEFKRRCRKLRPKPNSLGMASILGCPPWACSQLGQP